MLLEDLKIDRERLAALCRRYGVMRLEVFGSFPRGDAGADSDLDILVTFEPDAPVGLELVALQQELESRLDRPVDLLRRSSLEHSPNKYFRRFATRTAESLYERT